MLVFVKCKYPLLTKVYLRTLKNAIMLKIVWCCKECHNLQRKCNIIACECMVYKLLLEILIIPWNSYRGSTSWPNHRLLVCLKGSYCLVCTQRVSLMVHVFAVPWPFQNQPKPAIICLQLKCYMPWHCVGNRFYLSTSYNDCVQTFFIPCNQNFM